MGLAIASTQAMYVQDALSQVQYDLGIILNTLTRLSMNSSDVTAKQNAAVQAYLQQHTDAEGVIDDAAFEYVNSSAFTARFDAELRQIQAKETAMEQLKTSLETKEKEYTTQLDGWDKQVDKGAQDCAYFK